MATEERDAAEAVLDPAIAAIPAAAKMVAMASPPGNRSNHRCAALKISSTILELEMN
jgi:hypothetical protein